MEANCRDGADVPGRTKSRPDAAEHEERTAVTPKLTEMAGFVELPIALRGGEKRAWYFIEKPRPGGPHVW